MNANRNGRPTTGMRRDKQLQPHTDDSYRIPRRVPGGTVCRECGAVCDNGRWVWNASAESDRQLLCPACRRIRDHVPAGDLWLEASDYLNAHLSEIVSLLSHQARSEQAGHALERVASLDVQPAGVHVTTTGQHMVRRLGEALLHAHHGTLTIEYRAGETLLRARWHRGPAA